MSEKKLFCRLGNNVLCDCNKRKGCEATGVADVELAELSSGGCSHLVVQYAPGEALEAAPEHPSIMIVDDTALMRRKMRDALEGSGYNVVGEADDGDVAVEMACRLKPDLIIMDINMNRMCGIEATSEIKRRNPEAKIVVLTSEARPSVVLQSLRAGAMNFLPKSTDIEGVVRTVRNALAR